MFGGHEYILTLAPYWERTYILYLVALDTMWKKPKLPGSPSKEVGLLEIPTDKLPYSEALPSFVPLAPIVNPFNKYRNTRDVTYGKVPHVT